MGILDAPFRGIASTLIGTLGARATYTRKNPGTYDARMGRFTGGSESSATVGISPPDKFSTAEIDKTAPVDDGRPNAQGRHQTVLRSDFKIMVAARGFPEELGEPRADMDYLTIGSSKFRVVALAEVLWSGDQIAAWVLQCRL